VIGVCFWGLACANATGRIPKQQISEALSLFDWTFGNMQKLRQDKLEIEYRAYLSGGPVPCPYLDENAVLSAGGAGGGAGGSGGGGGGGSGEGGPVDERGTSNGGDGDGGDASGSGGGVAAAVAPTSRVSSARLKSLTPTADVTSRRKSSVLQMPIASRALVFDDNHMHEIHRSGAALFFHRLRLYLTTTTCMKYTFPVRPICHRLRVVSRSAVECIAFFVLDLA
jgi:hypothetical protein